MLDRSLDERITEDVTKNKLTLLQTLSKYGIGRNTAYRIARENDFSYAKQNTLFLSISEAHKELGRKLAAARVEKLGPDSERKAATELGMTFNQLRRIERGSYDVTYSVLLRMLNFYEKEIAYIL